MWQGKQPKNMYFNLLIFDKRSENIETFVIIVCL